MRKLLALSLFLVATLAQAVTIWHVTCPATATNDCLAIGTACDFSTLWTKAVVPGDTVIAEGASISTDGHYTTTACMLAPPATINGTLALPITIQAATRNNVLLDGGGVRAVVSLDGHHDMVIDGFDACCAGPGASSVWNLGGNAYRLTIQYAGAWDTLIDHNAVLFSTQNTPPAGPLSVNIDTFFAFGISRKNGIVYQTDNTGQVNARRGIIVWAGSTNTGPKIGWSMTYHGHNHMLRDTTAFWTGSKIPAVNYQLMNNGIVYVSLTSLSSKSVATGSKTWTVSSGGTIFIPGANPRCRVFRTSAPATYMEGVVTASTATSVTVNVDTIGGSGGPFTDWSLNKVYLANTVDQAQGMFSFDSGDGLLNTNLREYGNIGIIRNADTNAPPQVDFMSKNGDVQIKDGVSVIGSSYPTKWGHYLANCTTCPGGPHGLVATNLTTIGGAGNTIGTEWAQTNVATLANNSTFTYDGSTGTSKANICYLHDDTGAITTTPRWPHPMEAAMVTAMTFAGYTPITESTEIATALGAIPAACNPAVTPTPTPTTAGNTPTPTMTGTPNPTPTRTPTYSSNCVGTHYHTKGGYVRHTHSGQCQGTLIAPHQHLPVATPAP